MKNIVELLINYLETGDEKTVLSKQHNFERDLLNSVCFELLSWLKLERKRELWIADGRKTTLKPLVLSNYPWCDYLKELVQTEPVFNTLFEYKNGYICFKSEITDEYRKELRNSAFLLYNPPKTQ